MVVKVETATTLIRLCLCPIYFKLSTEMSSVLSNYKNHPELQPRSVLPIQVVCERIDLTKASVLCRYPVDDDLCVTVNSTLP